MESTMLHNGNAVRFSKITFLFNVETNRFDKQPSFVPFTKLPNDLKVEPTHEQKIRNNGANEVISGRFKNGKRVFFTGLQSTGTANVFRGNAFDQSEILFHFSTDFRTLWVYYFNGYRVVRPLRAGFYQQFVAQVLAG